MRPGQDRPNTRPKPDRPFNDRPPWFIRPSITRPFVNRPIVAGFNRPTNILAGGTTINNTAINNFARPWGSYHQGWYHGHLGNGWGAIPRNWGGASYAGGPAYADTGGTGYSDSYASQPAVGDSGWSAPAVAPSTVVYSNPYYAAPADSTTVNESPTYTVPSQLDYSQPIAAPTPAQQANTDEDVTDEGMKVFEQARTAFKGTMYRTALSRVEAALKLVSGDTTMHEFRALCLFALGRFKDAAGALYAVLSAGPGWNWDTMIALYADPDTYTRQLRRLEKHVKDNQKDAQGHFLLGYHYLVLDQREDAAAEFSLAAQMQPKDKLSASLAAAATAKKATTAPADE
jgi:hypothetical protein